MRDLIGLVGVRADVLDRCTGRCDTHAHVPAVRHLGSGAVGRRVLEREERVRGLGERLVDDAVELLVHVDVIVALEEDPQRHQHRERDRVAALTAMMVMLNTVSKLITKNEEKHPLHDAFIRQTKEA